MAKKPNTIKRSPLRKIASGFGTGIASIGIGTGYQAVLRSSRQRVLEDLRQRAEQRTTSHTQLEQNLMQIQKTVEIRSAQIIEQICPDINKLLKRNGINPSEVDTFHGVKKIQRRLEKTLRPEPSAKLGKKRQQQVDKQLKSLPQSEKDQFVALFKRVRPQLDALTNEATKQMREARKQAQIQLNNPHLTTQIERLEREIPQHAPADFAIGSFALPAAIGLRWAVKGIKGRFGKRTAAATSTKRSKITSKTLPPAPLISISPERRQQLRSIEVKAGERTRFIEEQLGKILERNRSFPQESVLEVFNWLERHGIEITPNSFDQFNRALRKIVTGEKFSEFESNPIAFHQAFRTELEKRNVKFL